MTQKEPLGIWEVPLLPWLPHVGGHFRISYEEKHWQQCITFSYINNKRLKTKITVQEHILFVPIGWYIDFAGYACLALASLEHSQVWVQAADVVFNFFLWVFVSVNEAAWSKMFQVKDPCVFLIFCHLDLMTWCKIYLFAWLIWNSWE